MWRIDADGTVAPWIQDEALVGTGVLGFGVNVGANGIAYHKKTVYVANTEKGTVVRIPVEQDGSAGTPDIILDGHLGLDGLALDVAANLYAVNVVASELIRIDLSSGDWTLLSDGDDGLDGSASLAFGTGQGNRKFVFITNFTLLNPVDPSPGVVKVDVGIPGKPLP